MNGGLTMSEQHAGRHGTRVSRPRATPLHASAAHRHEPDIGDVRDQRHHKPHLHPLKSMGSTRGNAETGFIRSVDGAVDRFHSTVIVPLEPRPTRRLRPTGAEVAATG
jgi:hypothetical protein